MADKTAKAKEAKRKEAIEKLSQLGIMLPPAFNFNQPNAIDILYAAVGSSVASRDRALGKPVRTLEQIAADLAREDSKGNPSDKLTEEDIKKLKREEPGLAAAMGLVPHSQIKEVSQPFSEFNQRK